MRLLSKIVCLVTIAAPAVAFADPPDAKFSYVAPPDKPAPDKILYTANAQAGFLLANGNAETYGLSGSADFGVKFHRNVFDLFAQGAYTVIGTSDFKGGPITGTTNSVRNWLARPRYDRFLSDNNSLFVLFSASGDEPSGFVYRLEPMAGYKRLLLKTAHQVLSIEGGYAFTHDKYIAGSDPLTDNLHNLRLYLFYENKFTRLASISQGLEILWAMNLIERIRINSVTSLSSSISKSVSLKLNLTVKANLDPTNRPAGVMYTNAAGVAMLSPAGDKFEKVDTILEAVLAVTFL